MSDTSAREPGQDRIIADFDQTNGVLDDFEGESGGTADGESRSAADREDDGVGGGGVLDDLHDGRTDPYVDSPDRVSSTADDGDGIDSAGDDRATDRTADFGSTTDDSDRLNAEGIGSTGSGHRAAAVAADADSDTR
jgi:hypothetical protein